MSWFLTLGRFRSDHTANDVMSASCTERTSLTTLSIFFSTALHIPLDALYAPLLFVECELGLVNPVGAPTRLFRLMVSTIGRGLAKLRDEDLLPCQSNEPSLPLNSPGRHVSNPRGGVTRCLATCAAHLEARNARSQ